MIILSVYFCLKWIKKYHCPAFMPARFILSFIYPIITIWWPLNNANMKKSFRLPVVIINLRLTLIVILSLQFPLFLKAQIKGDTTSYIQVLDVQSGKIDTVLSVQKHFEAPNWHPGNFLILNSSGKLYTLDITSKKLAPLNTGFADKLNNDHGISPDAKWLAFSHNDQSDTSKKPYKSAIYIVPVAGGQPKRVTPEVPSFWHGWSPDGKTLAYCAERNGNFDIYTIGIEGGAETRLTDTKGLDDGPDYSPDGKFIYFNSYRTGHMQIWRMHADGSMPEQLTFDDNSNWFAHPSPDSEWIVYIAYTSDEKQNHLFGKNVKLCLMNTESKVIKDITPVFYGGQGTINVPSWSPDGKKIAFVSYSVKQ